METQVASTFPNIKNICETLSHYSKEEHNRSCIGVISTENRSVSHLYLEANFGFDDESLNFIQLPQTFKGGESSVSKVASRSLSKLRRLEIARTVATRLFQLNSTPWDDWRLRENKDILYRTAEQTTDHNTEFEIYISQVLGSNEESSDVQEDLASGGLPHFANNTMWKLSLLLIELCLNKPIQAIQGSTNSFVKVYDLMNRSKINLKFGKQYNQALWFCLKSATHYRRTELQQGFLTEVIGNIERASEYFNNTSK
jgi:hypothetical protein